MRVFAVAGVAREEEDALRDGLAGLSKKEWAMRASRAHRMKAAASILLLAGVLAANSDSGADPDANGGRETSATAGERREYTEDVGGAGMKMVWIPPGSFEMGANDGSSDERPVHTVQLDGFWMGATEVTVGQFERFTSQTAFETQAEGAGACWGVTTSGIAANLSEVNWRNPGFNQSDSCPVTCVTWNDAQMFCSWLSRRMSKEYRLPTEAQWEYACRAGTKTRYPWGNDPGGGGGWCNAADQSAKRRFPTWLVFDWDDGFVFTAPVGSFKANAFGLYDMVGNVWEWCSDYYDTDYYARSPRFNPDNALFGELRVWRGGSWFTVPDGCRSANRREAHPASSSVLNGFRVIRIPERRD